MATSADQINTTQLTQLLILNLGSRNACMRALVAHPTDLNAAANWLINHRNDANIDTDPFAAPTNPTRIATNPPTNIMPNTRYQAPQNTNLFQAPPQAQPQPQAPPHQHSQQHMIQQVMNLGYTRDEALRAYTNAATADRSETAKLVDYLVKNPKKPEKKSSYNTYSNNSSYYPYSSSNKKKVYRPVINIDDIKVEKEEICDIEDCESLEHIGIILREYKQFLTNTYNRTDNHKCDKGKEYEKNGFYAYFLNTISGDGEYTLSDVMDDFIHLLVKHDVRYGEFSKVHKYILGKEALKGKIDNIHYDLLWRCISCNNSTAEERAKLYFGFQSVKEIATQQLCDKMYCYLVQSYESAAKLNYDHYMQLDAKYDIPPYQHKETGKVKEKCIAQYIGATQYVQYAALLSKEREMWREYDEKVKKFYLAFQIKQLEKRIDPKELKSKLAREKREKKRKEKLEKDRLKALQQVREQKEKQKELEKEKEKENDKATDPTEAEAVNVVSDDKKTEPIQPKPSKAELAEPKTEELKPETTAESNQKPIAAPNVLPPKIEEKKEDKREFSFGVRYNYWSRDMEDLIGISINCADAKYKTLAEELMGNGLSVFEYNVLSEKAGIYFQSEYCQDIEAGVNPFGIRLLAKITKQHIMSLMVYCNYKQLRCGLYATYIRQPGESDADMIGRHSLFYHLGRLLRESIECYGVEAHRSETKVFYHGMEMNTEIMSDDGIKSLFIYPPFSTTSAMEICLNEGPALIMELKGYVSKYFDCAWISDLCFEKEQIFCGGTRALTVNKCIDLKYGYDHKLFIDSMKYIPNIFKTNVSEWKINKNDDMLQETKEMIRNLLYYQLNKGISAMTQYPDNLGGKDGIPANIEQGLNAFCGSTTEVRMHYDAMYNHRAYGFLSSLFMTATRTFAKLDVIQQLFPKIDTFSMISTPLTTLTFLYVKSFINPPNAEDEKDDHKAGMDCGDGECHNKSQVLEIRLIDPKTAAMSIEQVIQAEKKSLAQLQWTIYSPDKVSLVLKYSSVPVIIKEATPPPPAPVVQEKKEEKKDGDMKQLEGKRVMKKRRRKRPPGQKPRGKAKAKPKAKAKTEQVDEGGVGVGGGDDAKPEVTEQQK